MPESAKDSIHMMKKQRLQRGRLFVLEVEEKGKIKTLELEEGEICWEGFRKVHGKLIRGVPRRSHEDCFRYCHQEGCELL
jgi:hypothetical protein